VSAPAFTPGPWTVESRVAFGKNDYAVSPASGNDGFVAALTHGPDAKANASLIAAAPELYEALERINDTADIALDIDWIRRISRAALAKARGEQ
jgi:hypothetical protein